MRVRAAEPRDTEEFSELNRRFNGCAAQIKDASDRAEKVIVAEVEGKLVGFACVQIIQSMCSDSPWAELTELFVDEASQRRGIGTALVSEAERIAWRHHCSELVLRTRASNRAARSLFERCGFEGAQHAVYRKRHRDPAGFHAEEPAS